jgi:hypothetical protein
MGHDQGVWDLAFFGVCVFWFGFWMPGYIYGFESWIGFE